MYCSKICNGPRLIAPPIAAHAGREREREKARTLRTQQPATQAGQASQVRHAADRQAWRQIPILTEALRLLASIKENGKQERTRKFGALCIRRCDTHSTRRGGGESRDWRGAPCAGSQRQAGASIASNKVLEILEMQSKAKRNVVGDNITVR